VEEAGDLLNILEHEVLPTYFRWDGGGYSSDWVRIAKESMKSTIPRFNAQRMLQDYVNRLYLPAQRQRRKLEADDRRLARELASWKQHIRQAWPGVSMKLMVQPPAHLYHDEKIWLRVSANLNGLAATDVRLECLFGWDGPGQDFKVQQVEEMPAVSAGGNDTEFEIEFSPQIAGLQYYKLRMYPYNDALSHPFEMGCMIWV
jgi:starch phosphorylase